MTNSQRPILVTGSHRSGTTWVGRTISEHPRVRYVHEPFNVDYPNMEMGLKLDIWFADAETSNQKIVINNSFNELLKKRPLKVAVGKCRLAGMDVKTPLRFGKYFMMECLSRERILVKDPIALLSAAWLYEKYNFKVICMVRNPFAFIGSLKAAGWDFNFEQFRKQKILMAGRLYKFTSSIEDMCAKNNSSDFIGRAILLWNILHFIILEYQKKYPDWLFVKHEDISESPNTGFQEIFDYLELDINYDIRQYIDKYTSQKSQTEETTSYKPRNSKLLLDTWKIRLSDDEIYRIKKCTSEIASQFYEEIAAY